MSTAALAAAPASDAEKQQHARVEHVGEVRHRTAERADDETRLHGHRQPRRLLGDMPELARRATGVTAVAENHNVIPKNSATASAASMLQAVTVAIANRLPVQELSV